MSNHDPDVTLIVPTYRRTSVARTLTGIAAQTAPFDYELIVVDNDVNESARDIVAEHSRGIAAPTRYIVEPKAGSSFARNTAIAAARGAVIAWCDDDVEPRPGWLAALVAPILSGRADGTGGRVILDPSVPRPTWFDEAGIGGYVTSFHLSDVERELVNREFVVTANAAYTAQALRRIGGFDPALGTMASVNFGGDDVRVSRAIRATGGRLRYVPDAVVIHELPLERLRAKYLLRRAWWVGRSDWVLDAETLRERRYGGAAVALDWYRTEVRRRRAEGLLKREVLFHALCDIARMSGSLTEAASLSRRKHSSGGEPADTVES
ncbi:MAG: glycosyltransferase family 2 protein [Actinomycetes bacterium]